MNNKHINIYKHFFCNHNIHKKEGKKIIISPLPKKKPWVNKVTFFDIRQNMQSSKFISAKNNIYFSPSPWKFLKILFLIHLKYG